MKVLSVKLTPSLECLRPAWRHGAASFMRPVPPLFQMSHGEFFTASQSLGRQSRKPYYIWGQAALKLTATAATAKPAQRDRGMFPISTWQQSKLHATRSHLLWCWCWTEHNALKVQETLDEPLEYANSLNQVLLQISIKQMFYGEQINYNYTFSRCLTSWLQVCNVGIFICFKKKNFYIYLHLWCRARLHRHARMSFCCQPTEKSIMNIVGTWESRNVGGCSRDSILNKQRSHNNPDWITAVTSGLLGDGHQYYLHTRFRNAP